MIKKFALQQIDPVMDIWLTTNISAHAFIDPTHWENISDAVRSALPSSDLYVDEEDGRIRGFIGITDHGYIAGLFVDQNHQSQGIGGNLLAYCKRRYPRLELDVFVENKRAVRFYHKHGFSIVGKDMNRDFNREEYRMVWPAQLQEEC